MKSQESNPLESESFSKALPPWASPEASIARDLGTVLSRGLSHEEAKRRLATHGPNQLQQEQRTSRLRRFLVQLKSPVVLILVGAAVVTSLVGEWVDAIAISVIVLLNSVIGYFQEQKAEAAVDALKKLSAPKARVLRDSAVMEIPATEIVRGDCLVFEAGDFVPADARLYIASQLTLDEAILTGESLPVSKSLTQVSPNAGLGDRSNMVFASTVIATGSARAIVTATGMQSQIGKIASLIESTEVSQTPLQIRLESVSRKLLMVCLGVVAVVAVLGLIRQEPPFVILMLAIGLAVAAIPEGLPAVVTLALALAVRRMAKRNAIMRHLAAVETLGSTDVICTDKTGTLTTGKMRVRLVALSGRAPCEPSSLTIDEKTELMAKAMILCNNASLSDDGTSTGDPTEVALLVVCKDIGIEFEKLRGENPRRAEWSFDSQRKRMSVAADDAGQFRLYVKGAPEAILPLCNISEHDRTQAEKVVEELSQSGKRLLAIATRQLKSTEGEAADVECELEYLGLVAIADPPRLESIEAIRQCKGAGIRVVMITGDHPATARAIAVELGIMEGAYEVISGSELEALSKEELMEAVPRFAVYARVSPEHKLRIVRAWRDRGHIVAMTGDGVNDAPALKAASIGISMGKGGTEVARQASSMILTDDNFATIVAAVEEGRAIYGNIRRTIQYLLSGNLAEILIMFGAAVLGWPMALAPIHLLWVNLVTDGLPSLALAAEPLPKGGLAQTSRPSPTVFFDKKFYQELSFVSGTVALIALVIYGYQLNRTDEITARSHLFSFLVFAELFRSFASRSESRTYFQLGKWSNLYHIAAVAFPIGFQLVLHHSAPFQSLFKVKSIDWNDCLILLALSLIPVTLVEISKLIRHLPKRLG